MVRGHSPNCFETTHAWMSSPGRRPRHGSSSWATPRSIATTRQPESARTSRSITPRSLNGSGRVRIERGRRGTRRCGGSGRGGERAQRSPRGASWPQLILHGAARAFLPACRGWTQPSGSLKSQRQDFQGCAPRVRRVPHARGVRQRARSNPPRYRIAEWGHRPPRGRSLRARSEITMGAAVAEASTTRGRGGASGPLTGVWVRPMTAAGQSRGRAGHRRAARLSRCMRRSVR